MAFTTLIDTATLADHLADPSFVIVDCRFRLDDESWGEGEYLANHITGAVYAHLDRDLSGSKTGANGRHPLPTVAALSETFGRFGIAKGTQVVAYDQDAGMYASRLWWLLRWLGHEAAAVLDGGYAKWTAEGRPTGADRQPRTARVFIGAARAGAVAVADEVAQIAARPDWRLLDARAPERFSGEVETIDRAAGHIPGATNVFFKDNLDDRGVFRSPEDLRRRLGAALAGVPADRVVCYCGSGVTACHNLLALEHAGLRGARLYPGSWSEWSSDPVRAIAVGKEAAAATRKTGPA